MLLLLVVGAELAVSTLCWIKLFSFLMSLVICHMFFLEFVGGKLYPRPKLSVFAIDSLMEMLEWFSNLVILSVNLLVFFFCQFLSLGFRCSFGGKFMFGCVRE
jgi:hypothetical protein